MATKKQIVDAMCDHAIVCSEGEMRLDVLRDAIKPLPGEDDVTLLNKVIKYGESETELFSVTFPNICKKNVAGSIDQQIIAMLKKCTDNEWNSVVIWMEENNG